MDSLQSTASQYKIDVTLQGTNTTKSDKTYSEMLQAESINRRTALLSVHADTDRLKASFSDQMDTKLLRLELQVYIRDT